MSTCSGLPSKAWVLNSWARIWLLIPGSARVSVAFDDDQVVLDVRRFAAHLIQSIVRDTQRAGTLTARDRDAILTAAAARRPLPGSERRLAAKLAAKFWVANAELAGEVTSTLAGVDLQRPAGEVLENVNRALEAIAAGDRLPSSSSTTPTASPAAPAAATAVTSSSERSSALCCERSPSYMPV